MWRYLNNQLVGVIDKKMIDWLIGWSIDWLTECLNIFIAFKQMLRDLIYYRNSSVIGR